MRTVGLIENGSPIYEIKKGNPIYNLNRRAHELVTACNFITKEYLAITRRRLCVAFAYVKRFLNGIQIELPFVLNKTFHNKSFRSTKHICHLF